MSQLTQLKCPQCDGELGLRERYERLLDLLESGLIVYNANNKFEANQQNPELAAHVMEASVQMYDILAKYWNDIPGDNVQEKINMVEEKRIYQRDVDGNVIPQEKNTLIQ